MPEKDLPSGDQCVLSLERLESRTMLSLAPAGVAGINFEPAADLPCVVEMADVARVPASSLANAGLDNATGEVPAGVALPEAERPVGNLEHGPPEDPGANGVMDEVPPEQANDHHDAGPPEETAAGPASTNAAEGLETATDKVPETVSLPQASRVPGDEGDQGPPENVIPGPASQRAADGLSQAAAQVRVHADHVNLPQAARPIGQQNEDDPS